MEVFRNERNERKAEIPDGSGGLLRQVGKFKYLGATLSEKDGSEAAVKARVSAAWAKWREIGGIFNDRRMQRRLKEKM